MITDWEEELSTLTESSRVRYISVMALVMDLSFILPLLDFISSSSSAGSHQMKNFIILQQGVFLWVQVKRVYKWLFEWQITLESRLPLTLFMVIVILVVRLLCVLNSGKHHRCIITYLKPHKHTFKNKNMTLVSSLNQKSPTHALTL